MSLVVDTAMNAGCYVEALCSTDGKKTSSVFECLSRPPISVRDYSARLGQFMRCSESTFALAAVLVQRLFDKDPRMFTEFAALKILSTAVVIAIKSHEDSYFSNRYYAECAGVSLSDLNLMESAFLNGLEFRVFVAVAEFENMKFKLMNLEKYLIVDRQPQPEPLQTSLMSRGCSLVGE